jgi:hypothetical protein
MQKLASPKILLRLKLTIYVILHDFSLIALNASSQPNDKVSSPQRASFFNLYNLAIKLTGVKHKSNAK